MALFGLIFGYFFFSATVFFVNAGMRQQLGGQSQPMSINEYVISPLLGNASVVGLFLIPLYRCALRGRETHGTIELLMTSPISDWEIILGKWLGAMSMYLCILAVSAINVALLFAWGRPDWRPILTGFLGLILQGGTVLAIGTFISTTTKNQIIAGAATFSVCLLLWVLSWVSRSIAKRPVGAGRGLLLHPDPFRALLEGHHRQQGPGILHFSDLPGTVPDVAVA